jgi:hypothetical protein
MTGSPDFAEPLAGKLVLASGEAVGITATRWHWRTLAWLDKECGRPVAEEFGALLAEHPDQSPDQLFAWYVELHYEALEAQEEAG